MAGLSLSSLDVHDDLVLGETPPILQVLGSRQIITRTFYPANLPETKILKYLFQGMDIGLLYSKVILNI